MALGHDVRLALWRANVLDRNAAHDGFPVGVLLLAVIGAAFVLIGAAIVASLMPATRASRIDVLQALRSE